MRQAQSIAVAIAVSVATAFVAAQAQPAPAPAPPPGAQGGERGGEAGQGRGAGRGGAAAGAPARGITINQNVIQKATAKISGEKISGTVEFNEYQVANGGLVQVVFDLQGVPPGTHGVHIHTVGRCDAPDFASAGGHFDPGPAGNTDPDMNHPYHSGDLPNIVANAMGAVTATSYTTRINLGGPLSPIDADGAAIIIHANPDTNQTGTKGQGVGGGTPIACGVIVK
jgi:Cu-Zn family superoxide dismutase